MTNHPAVSRPLTRRLAVAAAFSLVAGLMVVASAWATFLGINGNLAYQAPDGSAPGIFSVPLGGMPQSAAVLNPAPVMLAGAGSWDVHWSPDASHIAFTSNRTGDPEIFTLDVADPQATPHQLTFSPGIDADPSWSPDGQRIAWTSARGGNLDIWVMNAADGSGARQLTTNPAVDQQTEFAPTSDRMVFESDRSGSRQLYVMSGDGSGETQLTHTPGISADANWSPRGDLIAFTTGNVQSTNIAVVPAAGGTPRLLTRDGAGDQFPAWSPDGHQIAFDRAAFGEIEVIDAPDATGAGGGGAPTPFLPGVDPDWGNLQPVPPAPPQTTGVALTANPAVRVQPPGADRAEPLAAALGPAVGGLTRAVPFGTKVIATTQAHNPLSVSVAVRLGPRGGTAEVDATGGVYTIRRGRQGKHVALELHLGRPSQCRSRARTAAGPTALAAARHAHNSVHGKHHNGRVQASSPWTIAAPHLTDWIMSVSCDSTTTRVISGTVRVTDLAAKRTFTLHAGQRHVTLRP